jgi:predicted phage tail protein
MKTFHLHGALGQTYGEKFELDVDNVVLGMRLLCAQHRGMQQMIRAGEFKVVRGSVDTGVQLDELTLAMPIRDEIHIIPVPVGSKRSGLAKILIGVAIIGLAFVGAAFIGGSLLAGLGTGISIGGISTGLTWGSVALFGAMVALSGISQMLSPTPKKVDQKEVDQASSFLFNGAVNNSEQGGPVPLIYGRFLVGSRVISASLAVEDIPITAGGGSGSVGKIS